MIRSMHGLLLRLSQLPWPGVSAASFQAYAGVESSDEARHWHKTNPSVTESVSSLGELQSFSCFFLVMVTTSMFDEATLTALFVHISLHVTYATSFLQGAGLFIVQVVGNTRWFALCSAGNSKWP